MISCNPSKTQLVQMRHQLNKKASDKNQTNQSSKFKESTRRRTAQIKLVKDMSQLIALASTTLQRPVAFHCSKTVFRHTRLIAINTLTVCSLSTTKKNLSLRGLNQPSK